MSNTQFPDHRLRDNDAASQWQIAQLQKRIDRLEETNNYLVEILYEYFYESKLVKIALRIRDCCFN